MELERWEWRGGQDGDPVAGVHSFLAEHDLAGEPQRQRGHTAVALLAGAVGCARLAGLPTGRASPVPTVPEIVAVALTIDPAGPGRRGAHRPGPGAPQPAAAPGAPLVDARGWRASWDDAAHAAAVDRVRQAVSRGELYQANVVGHRRAAHRADPLALARRVAGLPGATYAGVLTGPGWAVGSASPEQLVRVVDGRVTTVPVKGTLAVAPGAYEALRSSEKDRAEHVMIVDLERNDLSRIAATGSVQVQRLYELTQWAGLWQAGSTVAAQLADGVGTLDVLQALLPGGSVTGAPKRAACHQLADLEPAGRGPSMGALGLIWPGGLDLGLTIRTIAADSDRVHLWAGGGITWGSDPQAEVAEAHAKAGPVVAVLARPA